MKKFEFKVIGMATCLGIAGSVWSQPGEVGGLDSVIVTATPIIESNRVDHFSAMSTRVSDAQIKDLGALDLAAGLRMMPGVQISRYNEVGSYSGDQGGNVYIRGLGVSRPGSEIKTYVDGLPVYMGLWNHPLMDLLPLNGIATINVHKGPDIQSSGNNFASVNLETRRAKREGVVGEATLSLGSYATKTFQGNILGKLDALDFMLAAAHVDSNGARPNADGRLNNAIGRLGLKIDEHWSLGGGFLAVSNAVGDPGDNRFPVTRTGVGPYTFSNGIARNASSTQMLNVFARHQHGTWQGELKFYQNRGDNDLTDDPSWGTFNSHFVMSGWRWKEMFSPWVGGQVVAEIDRQTIRGDVSGPHVGAPVGTPFAFGLAGSAEIPEFRMLSSYLGFNQRFDLGEHWMIKPSIGARHYDSNHYESKTAPQAGVSVVAGNVTFYANYVEGLLYPGAETNALTRAVPMAFAANNGWDRLQPSRDKHREMGMKWDVSANTHLDLSIFQDEISKRYIWSGFNAGAFAPPASGVWSNSFADYSTRGAEVSVQHQFTQNWQFFGGLTHLNPDIDNLPYAPRTAISAGITGNLNGFKLAFDAHRQSEMYSLTQDRGTFSPNRVAGFSVANIRVARPLAALGKSGEVFVVVNNLFAADYEYNAGYPMPGRNFRVGLTAGF